MTTDQYNKFLTLLMGGCWHQWSIQGDYNRCIHCKELVPEGERPDHLSNPLLVIRWMEKEMPEVWGDYLGETFLPVWSYQEFINKVLDLRNLVQWMKEHGDEWGEKECPTACNDMLEFKCCQKDNYCHGTGRITRPAWEYLKEVKGE